MLRGKSLCGCLINGNIFQIVLIILKVFFYANPKKHYGYPNVKIINFKKWKWKKGITAYKMCIKCIECFFFLMVLRNCLFIQRFRIIRWRNHLTVTHQALAFPASSAHQPCSVVTLHPVRYSHNLPAAVLRLEEQPRNRGEMVLLTMIARLADGLPLAASMQEDEQVKKPKHSCFANGVVSCQIDITTSIWVQF